MVTERVIDFGLADAHLGFENLLGLRGCGLPAQVEGELALNLPSRVRKKSQPRRLARLEWGSHWAEFSLDTFVTEFNRSKEAGESNFSDPISGKKKSFFHPVHSAYHIDRPIVLFPAAQILAPDGSFYIAESILDSRAGTPGKTIRAEEAFSVPLTPLVPMKFSSNYYHFLVEDLPRLIFLAGSERREITVVHSNSKLPTFQESALATLGMKSLCMPSGSYRFDRISFTPLLGESGIPSPLALSLVRAALLPTEDKLRRPWRRLFVSREGASRNPAWSLDVEEALTELGFQSVRAEGLTFLEQVRLFQEAEVVVGPHGAGLANSIFMGDQTQLIEIMDPAWANPVFEILSASRLKYQRIVIGRELEPRNSVQPILEFVQKSIAA